MNADPLYFAVVPAAGSGNRFGSTIPKQYTLLQGKTVVRHTLECLHAHSWLTQIVLVHAADDEYVDAELLRDLPRVITTTGGSQRAVSVLNGLWALHAAREQDWVLVHDAVRPCLHGEDLEKLRQSLSAVDDQAGILATPVRETLKRVDEDGFIMSTVDRSGLWQAATPQQARYGCLRQALEAGLGDPTITDEASALEMQGVKVKVVQGRPDNIKLTWPHDIALADAILMARKIE